MSRALKGRSHNGVICNTFISLSLSLSLPPSTAAIGNITLNFTPPVKVVWVDSHEVVELLHLMVDCNVAIVEEREETPILQLRVIGYE